MRSRDVVGRRIVRVEQGRRFEYGTRVDYLRALVLDDGREIRFVVHEGRDDYHVCGIVCGPSESEKEQS